MYHFPKDFYWGTSTSGPQTEGRIAGDQKGDNNWDYWYAIEPEKFHNKIGPERTSTFYEHFEEDIDLLVATGHTMFRTSIQWSRLIPNGVGDLNQEALIFYRQVFQKICDKGIRLMVNLYHFDMPYALEAKGGWENRETVYAFRDYAKACFENFGDLVDDWITFNEPIVHVECGYLYQYHYPNKVDAKLAVQVAYHTQLASSLAVEACHEMLPQHKIGIILNLTPAYPRSQETEDLEAAKVAELFQAKSFLDPSVKGHYPEALLEIVRKHHLMPNYEPGDCDLISQNTVDFLGVNYYQPLRVKAPNQKPDQGQAFMPNWYFEPYDMPGRKINPHRGWEIYEEGLYDIAQNIKDNYGNIEWILTENGMGVEGEEAFQEDGMIADDYRIDFVKNHLKVLHRAISDGANCKGYLMWTFIDCWSWLNAYKNRYGLVALDLETQERRIKKSGYWLKEVSDKNGFDD